MKPGAPFGSASFYLRKLRWRADLAKLHAQYFAGEMSIPIAQYGSSNLGKLKHVYRHGLWHRYGCTMQAIAGIHYNFSLPDALWPLLQSSMAN